MTEGLLDEKLACTVDTKVDIHVARNGNSVEAKLRKYLLDHKSTISLAGPPSLKGGLANFFKVEPDAGTIIKASRAKGYKVGIRSFVSQHPQFQIYNVDNEAMLGFRAVSEVCPHVNTEGLTQKKQIELLLSAIDDMGEMLSQIKQKASCIANTQ